MTNCKYFLLSWVFWALGFWISLQSENIEQLFAHFQMNQNSIENEQRATYFLSCSPGRTSRFDSQVRNDWIVPIAWKTTVSPSMTTFAFRHNQRCLFGHARRNDKFAPVYVVRTRRHAHPCHPVNIFCFVVDRSKLVWKYYSTEVTWRYKS